jgi:hypothetical protein
MEIELFTDDAHFVYRKDKESEYVLGETHFKAFSTDIPKEITDALNISETNIANQLDSPFLLSMSAGDVASFFNNIAHLTAIDKGTSAVNSVIRELTADIKYKEAQETKLLSDIDTYSHICIFESEVESLEKLDKNLSALTTTKDKLNNTTVNLRLNAISIQSQSKILAFEKPVNDILALIELRGKKDLEEVKLDKLVNDIQRNQVDIDEQNELLKAEKPVLGLLQLYEAKKILVDGKTKLLHVVSSLNDTQAWIDLKSPLMHAELSVNEILTLIENRKTAKDRLLVLSTALTSVKAIQDRITKGAAYIASQVALFDKEMPEICPLCNQSIKHEHTS